MISSTHRRRLVVLGAPLLLIPFSLAHGLDWLVLHGMHEDYDAFLEYIVDIRVRWLWVHIVGLAVFPLVGLSVWWMLPASRTASRFSRAGLTVYLVVYAAFDAIAGIGSAVVAEHRASVSVESRPLVDGIMWSLLGEADPTYYLGEIASYAWLIGSSAGAVALWQEKGWRVALPLLVGGVTMAYSHFPPFGAIAGAFLSIAAWQFVVIESRRDPASS